MATDTIDLSFLARQMTNLIDETRQLRKETADIRTLALQTFEFTRRVERRQSELRDDLEIAMKMEFGGAFTNLQTVIEQSLARIEDKIEGVNSRVTALESVPRT